MDFYSILRQILEEKGLSIAEAARICGVPDSTLRSIINRKNQTVALDVAMRISLGLDVSLERLNGIEGQKEITQRTKSKLMPEEQKLLRSFSSLKRAGKDYILQTMEMAIVAYKEIPEAQKREA